MQGAHNNNAGRALRPRVLARQLFYGCQSKPSALLLSQLSSIFTTLQQQGVNVRSWLYDYLHACALARGRPPVDAENFLTRHLPPQAAMVTTDVA